MKYNFWLDTGHEQYAGEEIENHIDFDDLKKNCFSWVKELLKNSMRKDFKYGFIDLDDNKAYTLFSNIG